MKYKLVLENGKEFYGECFGFKKKTIGELFFSTSMVGYQDILSDPSYYGKIACMTYPLIGNYGLTDDDYDFKKIYIKGYVVKENNDSPSNFRATRTLNDAMEENEVVGLSDIDTRELTRIIRDEGIMKAMICETSKPLNECLEEIKEYSENDSVKEVSCKKTWYSRTANPLYTVVVLDLGIKTTLVKKLNEYGLNVIIVPFNTKLEEIKRLKPNGIIISNGPGNPNKQELVKETISTLKGKYPLLALGLGAQITALTYGANVTKMKHGHQGSNLPIKNIQTGKIEISSQNHFYKIEFENEDKIRKTHINVIDNDIEGYYDEVNKVMGIQYQVQESLNEQENVINNFIKLMKK